MFLLIKYVRAPSFLFSAYELTELGRSALDILEDLRVWSMAKG